MAENVLDSGPPSAKRPKLSSPALSASASDGNGKFWFNLSTAAVISVYRNVFRRRLGLKEDGEAVLFGCFCRGSLTLACYESVCVGREEGLPC